MRNHISTFIRELRYCAHDDVEFTNRGAVIFILRRKCFRVDRIFLDGNEKAREFVREAMGSSQNSLETDCVGRAEEANFIS